MTDTTDTKWHGTYLSEDEIVADMLSRIKADPEALKIWQDPASFEPPILRKGASEQPKNTGCLWWAGMSVRNYYGLWHEACPYTLCKGDDLQVTDGIITDLRFPDNLSGRIIDRVKQQLQPGAIIEEPQASPLPGLALFGAAVVGLLVVTGAALSWLLG